MKVIIRADDFEFGEAVNYSILKAFRGGLTKDIGLISDMPCVKQVFDMIREENVTLGPHVNLILGSPCARLEQIPSLLNIDGKFLPFRTRRRGVEGGIDNFIYEDTVTEAKAQVKQFLSICGRLLNCIGAYAVYTGTIKRTICDITDAHGIDIKGHIEDTR